MKLSVQLFPTVLRQPMSSQKQPQQTIDSCRKMLLLLGCLWSMAYLTITPSWAGKLPPADFPAGQSESVQTFAFTAIGDSGSGNANQYEIARQLQQLHRVNPFQALLFLGDIIYPDGNYKKYGIPRFKKPYAPLKEAGVRFLPSLGNHDTLFPRRVNGLTQFYGMPAQYYTTSFGWIDFFALNTNHFNSTQAQWLDRALEESQASWKIVFGHHPIYTSGKHAGESDLVALKTRLEPLLVKHHVPLYLAGHDHNYERLGPVHGVLHLVSGGGGAYLRDFKSFSSHSKAHAKTYHFLYATVTPTTLHIQAMNGEGKPIDSITLKKEEAQSITPSLISAPSTPERNTTE